MTRDPYYHFDSRRQSRWAYVRDGIVELAVLLGLIGVVVFVAFFASWTGH